MKVPGYNKILVEKFKIIRGLVKKIVDAKKAKNLALWEKLTKERLAAIRIRRKTLLKYNICNVNLPDDLKLLDVAPVKVECQAETKRACQIRLMREIRKVVVFL